MNKTSGQLSLFNDEELQELENSQKLDPRNRKVKNPVANPTAFGWLFQVIAAIVLSLEYKENLKEVKVEGETEDIEIYLTNTAPIYAQAKATMGDVRKVEVSTPTKNAMNTLLNTSNAVSKYSKLIYISNFINPVSLDEIDLSARWLVNGSTLFEKNFQDIPNQGQEYLRERLEKAQEDLKNGKYLYTKKKFDWNKLYVDIMIFESTNEERKKINANPDCKIIDHHNHCVVLSNEIDEIVQRKKLKDRIYNKLLSRFYENAATKSIRISKNRLMGIFITEVIQETESENIKNIYPAYRKMIEDYIDGFLDDQSMNIDVINDITSSFYEYWNKNTLKNNVNAQKIKQNFVNTQWIKFKENFPIDKSKFSKKIQEEAIKLLILQIIDKEENINEIRTEFNEK
ncbi:hypothetical protein ACTND0_04020 [Lactobacillus amylovorus]|uniref:hypothetical protein n=1 Tax=Lactobacillus amylovorus TaxID=1604 RepID=UPI003F8A915C